MKQNLEYELVVRLINNRAGVGGEFTSDTILDDYSALRDVTDKTIKQVQQALSIASAKQKIVKVRHEKNVNRSGGNRFVWRGTLIGEAGLYCPSCSQKLPKPKPRSKPGNLKKWLE